MNKSTCEVAGCDRLVRSRGWCSAHYERWLTTGDVQAHKPFKRTAHAETPTCKAEDCGREAVSQGMCARHYARWKRHGVLGGPIERRSEPVDCAADDCDVRAISWKSGEGLCGRHYARWKRGTAPDALTRKQVAEQWDATIVRDVSGRDRGQCWTDWGGPMSRKGRPTLRDKPVSHLALEADGRPRPNAPANQGLHSCDDGRCWNPGHLRWGTLEDNARDRAERGTGCIHCPHCQAMNRL